MTQPVLAEIEMLLTERGGNQYGNECVTQLQHALQCAQLAARHGATSALIAAALLHDIGHLIHQHGEDAALRGIDDRHEAIGANYLAQWFPDAVVRPVRLHVDAKRYLCSAEPGYFARLSPESVRSLKLQGGPLTPAEARAFLAQPHAQDAVLLRHWDEEAKDPAAAPPPLAELMLHVERALEPARA